MQARQNLALPSAPPRSQQQKVARRGSNINSNRSASAGSCSLDLAISDALYDDGTAASAAVEDDAIERAATLLLAESAYSNLPEPRPRLPVLNLPGMDGSVRDWVYAHTEQVTSWLMQL